MKAWVLRNYGEPRAALQLLEHPDPEPAEGQVLIRCEGFGVNYADVQAVKGLYRDAPPVPFVPGYEVVGRVERCGHGVPADLLGRRVVAMTRFGGYAELAVTDHRALAVIPDELPLGVATALATQGCTAWYMSMIARPLRKGQRVLVHGAAGGVGQLLVQIAVHQGCTVFAVASGADKMAYLRQLGAQHPIDRRTMDHAQEVRRLLGDATLDASFNPVGGTTFRKDLDLLGSGGALLLFGGSARTRAGLLGTARFVWQMGMVIPAFLMMRCKALIGVNMLRISEDKPELIAECLQAVVQANAAGWLKPHVHGEYTHLQLPDALEMLGSGATLGKLAVRW
jgi:NADPH:quinone reductase-like Zn-dependent oxidoreductase